MTADDSTAPARRRRHRAWAVPAGVLVVVAAGAVVVNGTSAVADPTLPARSAEQLVADVLASSTRAFSGTVTETARLGLPALPGDASQASLSWQQLLTGTNTVQVWVDGPQRQRLAVTGALSEADVVHRGDDVWTYTSADHTVSHRVLAAPGSAPALPDGSASAAGLTPAGAARQALAAVDATTAVSVSGTVAVAGRSAYTLVLEPRDARSTVRRVAVAVDSRTGVPLRVEVFGAAAQPAFEVGFTHVDFATPAASTFEFTPPAGATVTGAPFGATLGPRTRNGNGNGTATASTAEPTVIGTGWTSVVEIPAAPNASESAGGVLDQLTTTLPTGAKLLHTALVNALQLPDGRTFVGAVGPDLLQQIAATR